MAKSRFRRKENSHSPSRLEVVQREARQKAVFWDRTSISSFLTIFIFLGLLILTIGCYGLSNGELKVGHYFQMDAAASGWRFTTICFNMIFLGINLIIPMPLFWTISERRTVIVCSAFLGINFCVFMYAFVIDFIEQSEVFQF